MPELALPAEWTQQLVRLQFLEPIIKCRKEEFLRIRLTMDGKASGEEGFHRADVVQPHRVNVTFCKVCHRTLSRIPDRRQTCTNLRCSEYRIVVEAGPTRGVVKVATKFEAADGRALVDHTLPDGMINGCILCLDRRYDRRVLKDVYRAACEVALQCGFRVL